MAEEMSSWALRSEKKFSRQTTGEKVREPEKEPAASE